MQAIEQTPATVEQVERIVTDIDVITNLQKSNTDAGLYAAFFGAKSGYLAQVDKLIAVLPLFATLVTSGGNKSAMLDPTSQRAQQSMFYRTMHAAKPNSPAVKGFRSAIEVARPYAAKHLTGDELVTVLQKVEDAFMAALPQRKPRAATDKVASAIKAIKQARDDHALTQEHIDALKELCESLKDMTPMASA